MPRERKVKKLWATHPWSGTWFIHPPRFHRNRRNGEGSHVTYRRSVSMLAANRYQPYSQMFDLLLFLEIANQMYQGFQINSGSCHQDSNQCDRQRGARPLHLNFNDFNCIQITELILRDTTHCLQHYFSIFLGSLTSPLFCYGSVTKWRASYARLEQMSSLHSLDCWYICGFHGIS